jgi:hypothetical protein
VVSVSQSKRLSTNYRHITSELTYYYPSIFEIRILFQPPNLLGSSTTSFFLFMMTEELRNELNKDLENRFERTNDYESVQMLAIT